MQRLSGSLFFAILIATVCSHASAQTDAEAAFEKGKAAYASDRFDQARNLFTTASQTDTANPEVFLWLGKAQYQLGALEEAITAWIKTLKLAPDEPYAKKMLDALRDQTVEIETKISLLETMVAEKLLNSARQLYTELLAENAFTDAQRVKVKTLQAEVLLATRKYEDTQGTVQELLLKYPKLVDAAKTTLLLGQAKKMMGNFAEGLALLKKVAVDFKGTPSAARAEYEITVFNLAQSPGAAGAKELSAWISANPVHPLAEEALGLLVKMYLEASRQEGKPATDAELSAMDRVALAAANDLFERTVRAEEALKLTRQIVEHFDKHYADNGANAAAIMGCQTLLKAQLPATSRLFGLRALARYRRELALKQLVAKAQAGQLVAGPLPDTLTDVLATYQTINKEFPAQAAWRDQVELAKQVRGLEAVMPWSSKISTPRPPYSWAVQIALQALKNAADNEVLDVTQQMIAHLDRYYFKNQAYAAAVNGCETWLKQPLPSSSRLLALKASARYRSQLALKQLVVKAQAGQLADGPLPDSLAVVVAAYGTIRKEFPAEPAWRDQAQLADRVRRLTSTVAWPTDSTRPKPCYSWSLDIVLPVIKADTDTSAASAAIKVVTAIIDDCAKHQTQETTARGMTLAINSALLDALTPANSNWPTVVLRQVDLLNTESAAVFADNLSAGRPEKNASLTDHQKELLSRLTTLLTHQVSYAPKALKKLNVHLQLWINHAHYKLAEQAYTQLAAALPKDQQIQTKLVVARLWRQQVFNEHNRLVSAGLTVPRKLDPSLTKALELCHTLQGPLDEKDALLAQIRTLWNSIVGHYRNLEYFDTVEEAINVKTAQSIPHADAYAALQLANLKFDLAQRDLALLLKQYNAAEKIALTPAFKTAIDAYQKFISDRPTDPLRNKALAGVFRIAAVFEKHKAHDVAFTVYRDFAEFAAEVKVLSQAPPASSSPLERAVLAAATALDAKARLALSKQIKDARNRSFAPAKTSDEFAATIEAYKNFIETYPKSVLLGSAIERIMAVAFEYAKVNAWDVADGIYADLIAKGPAIRRLDRIEFCRALCQLGKAMPEHAKGVLTALMQQTPRQTPEDEERAVAKMFKTPGLITGSELFVDYDRRDVSRDSSASSVMQPSARSGRTAEEADDIQISNTRVLAAIRQHEANQAARIAQFRQNLNYRPAAQQSDRNQVQAAVATAPVLSEAEIIRQQEAIGAAYEIFQAIRKNYPRAAIAEQCRGEIKVMIDHWRTLLQWKRAALLAKRFLQDNPSDSELPALSLSVARDYLAWAARPVEKKASNQLMLAEVARRFAQARDELTSIVAAFTNEQTLLHDAQWDIAGSFLTQARVIDAFSRTLARGQYVRAARELLQIADIYYDHPKIGTIPQMLWDISQELANRQYFDEAITVWNDLMIRYPTHAHAQDAALRIAQTYQNNLHQPLRAAEAYQEVNIARGSNDVNIQNTIYQIGVQLKDQKRWVESLHVLEMFVDSFPRHPQAGQALTTIGRIHQTNQAWDEAIAAYRRVIAEFTNGDWVKEAKWSIAECIINLSQWRQAMDGYASYLRDYPNDARKAEAERRVVVLKDLARYQSLVDEVDQRKAFDAQHQIATIVLNQLSNRVKAIIEYRKVTANWPKSHLADDALYAVGTTYLAMGEMDKARQAARAIAAQYPNSPMADDALFLVGKSYEDEANRLGTVTRATSLAMNLDIAQFEAYQQVQSARGRQKREQSKLIQSLKKGGKQKAAELQEARFAGQNDAFNFANTLMAANKAGQMVEALTAVQLANRQDKINAALRKAVAAYNQTSRVAGADKAGDALLRMSAIYNERLKDSDAAMAAWLEIVRQFSGTGVAEDASWRIAQHYESKGQYTKATEAYKAFLRNYRRSPKASDAQFAIAESYEHLGQWIDAMDAYTNYINNFEKGPMIQKAREQITWIKAYRL